MGEHPIAWYHEYGGGRAWYTGFGHTDDTFREPLVLEHLLGGIAWAAGFQEGEARGH
jgi:type 1 glutamine amidotransferase